MMIHGVYDLTFFLTSYNNWARPRNAPLGRSFNVHTPKFTLECVPGDTVILRLCSCWDIFCDVFIFYNALPFYTIKGENVII